MWFKTTKSGLHDAPTLDPIDFSQMPILLKLTELLDEIDSEINKKGGRIFISESLVFKITKGAETPLLTNQEKVSGPAIYQKLCDEIRSNELEKDRFRTEETYILTKSVNGEWSMSVSHENLSGTKNKLDLNEMPLLKILALKINKADPQFQANGGRIFITPTRVYRIKNKIEINFKF